MTTMACRRGALVAVIGLLASTRGNVISSQARSLTRHWLAIPPLASGRPSRPGTSYKNGEAQATETRAGKPIAVGAGAHAIVTTP